MRNHYLDYFIPYGPATFKHTLSFFTSLSPVLGSDSQKEGWKNSEIEMSELEWVVVIIIFLDIITLKGGGGRRCSCLFVSSLYSVLLI